MERPNEAAPPFRNIREVGTGFVRFDLPQGGNEEVRVAPLMRRAAIESLFTNIGDRISLMVGPIVDNYINEDNRGNCSLICSIAYFISHSNPNFRDDRRAQTIAQCCAVGFPADVLATPEQSRDALYTGLRATYATLPDAVKFAQVPNWVNEPETPVRWEDATHILYRMANQPGSQVSAIQTFTHALLTFAKRGTVSNGVLNKVTTGIRDELGVTINLDGNTIRAAWALIGHWYTPANARRFFELWEGFVGNRCMRLRLICQQANWTSMTNFQNIARAKQDFPDFPWANAATLFQRDFDAYQQAVRVVGGDPFYGYNNDLGPARSTLYPNLSYLAYALLTEIAGDRALRDFQGTNRNTPFAANIDQWVRDFRNTRLTQAIRPTAASRAAANIFMTSNPLTGGVGNARPPREEGQERRNGRRNNRGGRGGRGGDGGARQRAGQPEGRPNQRRVRQIRQNPQQERRQEGQNQVPDIVQEDESSEDESDDLGLNNLLAEGLGQDESSGTEYASDEGEMVPPANPPQN